MNKAQIIMEIVGIALMIFTLCSFITALYYITMRMRYKEKKALLDRGMDPDLYTDQMKFETLKMGMAFLGAGMGFITGILLDSADIFESEIELPLYFAPILFFMGIALIIYYRIYTTKFKK